MIAGPTDRQPAGRGCGLLVFVRGRTDSRRRGDCCFAGSSCRPLAGILLAPTSGGLVLARERSSEPYDPIGMKAQVGAERLYAETQPGPAPTGAIASGRKRSSGIHAASHPLVAEAIAAHATELTTKAIVHSPAGRNLELIGSLAVGSERAARRALLQAVANNLSQPGQAKMHGNDARQGRRCDPRALGTLRTEGTRWRPRARARPAYG